MIDFHSHVLPGIDDGAKTVDDSVALVRMLLSQGIAELVLTPHFYPERQSLGQFLSSRDMSFQRLKEGLDMPNGVMRFHLGAEVFCSDYLMVSSDLNPLCIQGTQLLLLEMPFSSRWPSDCWHVIEKIQKNTITPIIAHAERYPAVLRHPSDMLRRLADMGCVIQLNCDSFTDPALQGKVMKWLDKGLVHLLGTDCHDPKDRPPRMKEAMEVIRHGLGGEMAEKLESNASRLISGKPLRGRDLFF